MIEQAPRAISLFYCYDHKDAWLRDELEKHLETLRREHLIESWHAQEVLLGAVWEEEVTSHLRAAQIIVLLVSADFLAYCYTPQMMEALQRHQAGEAVVLPLILRPVDWSNAPFSHLQVLPADGKPVTTWHNQDEAFAHIAQGIRAIVEAFRRPIMLVSSPSQEALTLAVARDLELHNIPLIRLDSSLKWQEETIVKYIRCVSMSILVVLPEVENLRLLRRVGQLANIYRRPLIVVRVKEEGQEEVSLPAMLADVLSIETRADTYSEMCKQLLVHLKKRLSMTPEISVPARDFVPRNPYKGLLAFGQGDTADFFGREQFIFDLTERITQQLEGERLNQSLPSLLTLIGPSGSGKSSLVMAGLLPHLRNGASPGSSKWMYLTPMVPGEDPLEALALTLYEHFPEKSFKHILDELSDDSLQGLHRYGLLLTQQRSTRAVLFIDQFEELFVQTADKVKCELFLDLLLVTLAQARCPFIVILTLRADFYGHSMLYPEFHQLIKQSQCSIASMGIDDLRQVIEGPAQLEDVQLAFEGDLVGELLLEMHGQTGALPFLQLTLESLFRQRVQHMMTLDAYHKIGGIKGALTTQAEAIYTSLSEAQRKIVRFLFLRLVNLGTANHDNMRRRARLTEFTFDDPEQHVQLQKIIDIFVAERLLTTGQVSGEPTIEVSHEVLLYGWDRFRKWLNESQDDIQFQQRLSSDANRWEESQKSRDWLYRGKQLKAAKAWAKQNVVSGQEVALIRASTCYQRKLRLLFTSVVLLCLIVIGGVIKFWPVPPSFPGQSDNNLNVSFTQIQASAFVLPNNFPGRKSGTWPDGTKADDIAAQRLDTHNPAPYGVVLNVRDLHQSEYSLLIEKVQVNIKRAQTFPDPLHVVAQVTSRYYSTNVFQALYLGDRPSLLDTKYTYPNQHVQLKSGETDTLTIELSSLVRTDLQFLVQITYRMGNELQEHLFVFSNVFQVVFSDGKNWYPS